IFAKYLQALGGAERLASLTSFVAKGTYSGYDTDQAKAAIEIYAKAPAQRTTIVHAPFGDSVRVYDGRAAWIASPDKPLPLIPLTGGNLEGAKIEAMVSFPTPIKQAFNQWRVTTTTIDDREVTVLQGTNPRQNPVIHSKKSTIYCTLAGSRRGSFQPIRPRSTLRIGIGRH